MPSLGAFFILVLVACGGGDGDGGGDAGIELDECPSTLDPGDSCSFTGRCWRPNSFSTCLSAWCTCEGGVLACEELAPRTGAACGEEPIQSCSYEGNPGCTTAPTSEACGCNADGTWHCKCVCYGASSTCGACPVGLPLSEIEGVWCETAGTECPYESGTCRCVDQGGELRMHCE